MEHSDLLLSPEKSDLQGVKNIVIALTYQLGILKLNTFGIHHRTPYNGLGMGGMERSDLLLSPEKSDLQGVKNIVIALTYQLGILKLTLVGKMRCRT